MCRGVSFGRPVRDKRPPKRIDGRKIVFHQDRCCRKQAFTATLPFRYVSSISRIVSFELSGGSLCSCRQLKRPQTEIPTSQQVVIFCSYEFPKTILVTQNDAASRRQPLYS